MKSIRILVVLLSIGLLAVGCSQETELTAPDTQVTYNYDKNGTETLGPPTIAIASGSCFAQGGVGMVAPTDGILNIDGPMGVTINQVLVYWAGGTTGAAGDDMVKINGNDVTGELIGGPTNFFVISSVSYWFSAYRADITSMGLVANGPNAFTITDFDFDNSGGTLDENNGIGMMVIYDDGTLAEISVLDGLDMAYFDYDGLLGATVPQTFTFNAEPADRMGRLVIFAGSVGVGRPNAIKLTTTDGDDVRDNLLGSDDGLLWDTLCLTDVLIPAGDTSLTVELISTDTEEALGASMAWVGAGLSVPVTRVEEVGCRVTGGGRAGFLLDEGEVNIYHGSGQVGARSALEPELRGEWTHVQKSGPAGRFVFRAGHPSAPKETEISWIDCADPDGCDPSHQSPVKQVDFAGIGNFNNLFNAPAEIADHVVVHESLHWFEVNIDDLGEPGGSTHVPEGCDPLGFGRNGDTELADCDCPDFYRIRIYEGEDASSNVMYEVYGYIEVGNFNTHRPTGYDRLQIQFK